MAKKYTLMNKEAIDELCKAVRESHSVSEAIDDDNLATNSTFSSVKIDNLIKVNKAENKEYTDKKIDESISGTIDDTLSNTSENAVQNKVIKSYVDNSLANIQTALSGKVDKEEGKSLISDSEITRLANVKNYDDTKVKSDISSMNTAINTNKTSIANIQTALNSKANSADVYTKSETDTKITEKVAEIVAGAPEDFDTLKEMSDWIYNHEDSAAAMNAAINANKTNIANIQAEIGDMETEIIRADDADSEGKCQLYKTVNGKRVDIEPKVNVSSSPYIYMTADEYMNLSAIDPDKLYWIIHPNNYHCVYKNGIFVEGSDFVKWEDIRNKVRNGTIQNHYSIGDQLSVNYNGNAVLFDIVAFDVATPADSNYTHSMTLIPHNCLENLMFDNQEPTATAYPNFRNYGNSRYLHSNIRLWLNSSGKTGEWWTAQHDKDVAPDYALTKAGFMSGFDDYFLSAIGKTKIKVAVPPNLGGGYDELSDEFFYLPSTAEVGLETNTDEGTLFQYFSDYDKRKKEIAWRLRTYYSASVTELKSVNTSGSLCYIQAVNPAGVAPACNII